MLPNGLPDHGLIAHRGLAHRFPENTMVALEAALACGVMLLEYDIQCTSDGVPILLHDESFERVSGLDHQVNELTLERALEISVGYPARFGDRFADIHAPTLEQTAISLAGHSDAISLVELKQPSIEHVGRHALVKTVGELLAPIAGRAIIISFDAQVLEVAKVAGFPIGFCTAKLDSLAREECEALIPDLLLFNEIELTDTTELWAGPWRHACWEVTNVERAVTLFDRGVHYVESMAVDELRTDPSVCTRIDKVT